MQQEKTVVHVYIADSGAGFTISGQVRQLVVVAECFACMACTDASGYINLFRNDVVPNLVYRFDVAAVSGDGCHICHAGIHIYGTYGMSYGFILFYHRFVCLTIGVFPAGISTGIQEELCLIKILFVSRRHV